MQSLLFLFLFLFSTVIGFSQIPSGPDLLQKSIQYHDPKGQWSRAKVDLFLEQQLSDGIPVSQQVRIDLPDEHFSLLWKKGDESRYRALTAGACSHELNGSSDISEADAKKYKLDCKITEQYRDYYVYLYGLPMKLTDPGTQVRDSVYRKDFYGKDSWVLTVDYEPEVGEHIWELYLDPSTYAMIGYAFYKDPVSRKGEYILIEGELTYQKMRIPKDRTWYTYPENEILGTDYLLRAAKPTQ